MKAYVTSVGERTTDLCVWALKRNGFDVVVIKSDTPLVSKLAEIYAQANDDFIRVDADVIVNSNCTPITLSAIRAEFKDAWWLQFMCFDWYAQDVCYGGVQFIMADAIPILKTQVKNFINVDRPETELSRVYPFYNPRRFESSKMIMGLHGYGIKDIKNVIRTKSRRGQSSNYDFELGKRIAEL